MRSQRIAAGLCLIAASACSGSDGATVDDIPNREDASAPTPTPPEAKCSDGATRTCAVIAGGCPTGTQSCMAREWGTCLFKDSAAAPPPCTTDCTSGTLSGDSLFAQVNRSTGLQRDWEPNDLVVVPLRYRKGNASEKLRLQALGHLVQLLRAATTESSPPIFSGSPYRSFTQQCDLFASYTAKDGCDKANTYSAQAGHSEHQLGTACDIALPDGTFIQGDKPVDAYLAANAFREGFVLSYPVKGQVLTGYQYEPWHWRYIGRKAAQKHRTLEATAGRAISTHEFMATIACLPPSDLDALQTEDPSDAQAAKKSICEAYGNSACQDGRVLFRCTEPIGLIKCPNRCVANPPGVPDSCE